MKALITGITGQDGSYLAEFLIAKGYKVHGIKRKSSSFNTSRVDHLFENKKFQNNFFLHYGDLQDYTSIDSLIKKIRPNEIYNLAAQSHVAVSFNLPEYTSNVNALGTLRILESIKNNNLINKTKFYQASTSEMFGNSKPPQNEKTFFYPRSPYAISKLFSYWATINYRESYGIFACNGILFNHESPRRGETFVTKKITRALSRIAYKLDKTLFLGNLNALRDWGHASDFVEMQWLMLQQKKPDDYVISTGKNLSVRDFIQIVCKHIGIKIIFKNKGVNEVGIIKELKNNTFPGFYVGQELIKVDKKFFRPAETNNLLGNSSKAHKLLKWKPKTSIEELSKEMIEFDLREARNQFILSKVK